MHIKTKEEIELMKISGRICPEALKKVLQEPPKEELFADGDNKAHCQQQKDKESHALIFCVFKLSDACLVIQG